jgi:hypothetical protein
MTARLTDCRRAIAFEQLHEIASKTMHGQFVSLRDGGKTHAASPEEFYGFQAEDVIEIHLHLHSFGSGVWYRLKDGRVIDALGKPSERDRAWYVISAH